MGRDAYLSPKTRSILKQRGVNLIENDYDALRGCKDDKFWGIMKKSGLGYDIDHHNGEMSLAEMTTKALDALSRNKKGFFLMVEGSAVDFAAHANDPVAVVSEVLGFDAAVKAVLDFAKKDGNTTVVITSDHGNSGIVLGAQRYSKYSKWNLKTALGELPNIKCTTSLLESKLKGVKPESMKDTIFKYSGITLTSKEEEKLLKVYDKTESDYMEVGTNENIQSFLAKVYNARTFVSYSSSRHNGEDVFYAVYSPFGKAPQGFITNQDMNCYLWNSLGLKTSPREMSLRQFRPCDEVLEKGSWSIGKDEYGDPLLKVKTSDGRECSLCAYSNIVRYSDGKTLSLGTPAVYVPADGKFYIPSDFPL